jgi:hypothetical protein
MTPTAGSITTIDKGTDADAMRRHLLAKVARRRARQLAMRDGHPSVAVGEFRQRPDEQ